MLLLVLVGKEIIQCQQLSLSGAELGLLSRSVTIYACMIVDIFQCVMSTRRVDVQISLYVVQYADMYVWNESCNLANDGHLESGSYEPVNAHASQSMLMRGS